MQWKFYPNLPNHKFLYGKTSQYFLRPASLCVHSIHSKAQKLHRSYFKHDNHIQLNIQKGRHGNYSAILALSLNKHDEICWDQGQCLLRGMQGNKTSFYLAGWGKKRWFCLPVTMSHTWWVTWMGGWWPHPPWDGSDIRGEMFACRSCRNGSLLMGIKLMVSLSSRGFGSWYHL